MDSLRTTPSSSVDHRVLLFGEYLADVFPERSLPGGAPFNVACHLAAFGITALLASRLGNDPLGDELRHVLTLRRVDAQLLQIDPRHRTGQVDVIPDGAGHRFEIPPDQAFDFIDQTHLSQGLAQLPAAPEVIYFGTLAQRNRPAREALAAILRDSEAVRFVDLNLRPPWVLADILTESLAAADIVKLGEDELCAVAETLKLVPAGASPEAAAQCLQQRFDMQKVVVTCGARGAWCLGDQGILRVAPVAVVESSGDAVGAGDAFSAVCILGHLLSWTWELTLDRAASFAAAICAIRGAVPEGAVFYETFQREWLT